MRNFTDDILKGTAMEEVQIIKTTSKAQPILKKPAKPKNDTAKETLAVIPTTPKKSRRKKSTSLKFTPKAENGNRRGIDYATVRIPKEFTLALKILFDGQKLTHIMDEVVSDYLNRHQAELSEKYSQLKFA